MPFFASNEKIVLGWSKVFSIFDMNHMLASFKVHNFCQAFPFKLGPHSFDRGDRSCRMIP